MVICALVSSTLTNMYLRSVLVKGNDLERRELGERGDICQYYGSQYSHTLFLVLPPSTPSLCLHPYYSNLENTSNFLHLCRTRKISVKVVLKEYVQSKKKIPPKVVCLPSLSGSASLNLVFPPTTRAQWTDRSFSKCLKFI